MSKHPPVRKKPLRMSLPNLYAIRRHCIASLQLAEESGQEAEANEYREKLDKLSSLIESLGGNKDFGVNVTRGNEKVRLSARNQIPGTVIELQLGAVNSTVKVDIGNGNILTSTITNEAVEELGLMVGDPVKAVIKSSDVMIGK